MVAQQFRCDGHLRGTFSRRRLLQLCGYCGLASVAGQPVLSQQPIGDESSFQRSRAPLPSFDRLTPPPAVAFPGGASSAAYDLYDNHWALLRQGADANAKLMVLPAQSSEQWIEDVLSHLPVYPWFAVAADEFGFVWVAGAHRLARLDPHHPEAGWLDVSATPELRLRDDAITAIGVGPSGAVLVSLGSGYVAEVDPTHSAKVLRSAAPRGVQQVGTDVDGNVWVRAESGVYVRSAAADAWQRNWELVARLPVGDHDLSGDVLNGNFYMAGGQNAGWGYPATPHVFDQIFELSQATHVWRVVSRLSHPRFYNGTSWLEGKVWVIAGNRRDSGGKALSLSSVEICDPATGSLTPGPSTPFALEMPVALHVAGRIYVAGGVNPTFSADGANHTYNGPGRLISIGAGETAWRHEPDAPVAMAAMAGTALAGRLYLMVAHHGLLCFDTEKRVWREIAPMHSGPTPRSPQVAALRGEVWVMGGRDISNQSQCGVYNPATNRWRIGPSLPHDCSWGAGGVLDHRVLVAGGAGLGFYSNATYLLRKNSV